LLIPLVTVLSLYFFFKSVAAAEGKPLYENSGMSEGGRKRMLDLFYIAQLLHIF
jgi:hypothetical protein